MGGPHHHAWCLAQPDAPARVRAILEELVAGGGGELVLGSIFNELIGWEPRPGEPEPVTDDVELTIKFDPAQLRQLLRLVGRADPAAYITEYGERVYHHGFRSGALEIVLTPDYDGEFAWLVVAEFSEDIGPNNGSWPLSVEVAELVVARLGGTRIEELLN